MSSQVPESEKYGLSFGSFESGFSLISVSMNGPNTSGKIVESYKPEIVSEQAEDSALESTSR